jgi:hypothetical protein
MEPASSAVTGAQERVVPSAATKEIVAVSPGARPVAFTSTPVDQNQYCSWLATSRETSRVWASCGAGAVASNPSRTGAPAVVAFASAHVGADGVADGVADIADEAWMLVANSDVDDLVEADGGVVDRRVSAAAEPQIPLAITRTNASDAPTAFLFTNNLIQG